MEHRVDKLEDDMANVKTRLAVAESNIKDIRDDIRSIKDDTKWLRRTVTSAIIVATIGGIIGFMFAVIKGGVGV